MPLPITGQNGKLMIIADVYDPVTGTIKVSGGIAGGSNSTDSGASDADTLRVELTDESKAAAGGGTTGPGPEAAGTRVTFSDEDRTRQTYSKNSGAVDATTIRVELSNESKALLQPGTTSVKSDVNFNNASTQLAAANAGRKELSIVNSGDTTLHVSYSTTDADLFDIPVLVGGVLFVEKYSGQVNGIWNAATSGIARMTEIT